MHNMKVPNNTLNVIPFFYIRMPDIAKGSGWEAPSDHNTWGGNIFPDGALHLMCMHNRGLIEVQESRDPNTLNTLVFGYGARIAILGNSLMFFQGDLRDKINKSLDDIEK